MTLSRDALRRLVELVAATENDEIDCDEVLRRVAGYVECLRSGRDPTPEHAQVVQHLKVCPECLEEFEAFCRVLGE